MIKVYIAAPYTLGDVAINVKKSIEVANILLDHGFIPFNQLLAHFHHLIYPREYEDWINFDLVWLETCDVILRLPGKSAGSDLEVRKAKEANKIVYYSIEELIQDFENN